MRLPIPDSNSKNFAEQRSLLLPGEEVAPVAFAAATLLCHLKKTAEDLLEDDWTRCAEPLPDTYGVILAVRHSRLNVYGHWDRHRFGHLWLSACRKC